MNLVNSLIRRFLPATPLLDCRETKEGECKVCRRPTKPSKHARFNVCTSCSCYSNRLPNDIYDDNFWYAHVDPAIVDRDLGHWRRVTRRFTSLVGQESFSHIVDLAGGLGLFSAALQEQFHAPAVLVDRCSIPESVIRYDLGLSNQMIKTDVLTYLDSLEANTFARPLIVNSHFIEHLELRELVGFLEALTFKFPGALLCLYFPNADKARNKEADFLHFNTNLPGEHRIVWSLRPFVRLLGQLNIRHLHAEPFDLDALVICRL